MNELRPDEIFDLLGQVRSHATHAFSGLGLIFYSSLADLPIVALGDQTLFPQTLPVSDRQTLVSMLAEISTFISPWHDGFHLIDANSFALTHISQFLSPPVECLHHSNSRGLPVGARHMAAMAGSRIASVSYTALLSNKCAPAVFQRGRSLGREVQA
ncbi:hypothetical protein FNZ56_04195 [Pseudoluteimonas lycopersici]|uniref:Uncharacterized protein n=1 Tax=Pseudoluteimonas lycopersici TaxID=1324796 RepID=A0A516V3M6_9GAMM|nr:hypothetical protein [Lysobacter lycopersici]QDQ73131.1 hypothetical protein FNZ56_04195 [Lysobacter lycopersici]